MFVFRALPLVLLAACVGRTALPSNDASNDGATDFDTVTDTDPSDNDGGDSPGDPVDPPSNQTLFFQAYADHGSMQLQGFGVDDAGNAITGGTVSLAWNGSGYASTFFIDRFTSTTQTLATEAWGGSWSPYSDQVVGSAIDSSVEIRDLRVMTNGEGVFCASLTGTFVDKGGEIYQSPNSRQSPVIALRTLDGNMYNSRQFENRTSSGGSAMNAQCHGIGADSARTYIAIGGLYGASVDLGFGPLPDALADPNGFMALYRYDNLAPIWTKPLLAPGTALIQRAAVDVSGRAFFGINHEVPIQGDAPSQIGTKGDSDIALYAYNVNGTLLFAMGYGSPASDTVNEVLTDGAGNTYICGTNGGAMLRYDGSALPSDTYGGGQSDGHIMKLDSSGNVVWLRTAGGIGNDSCSGLTLSRDGTTLIAVGAIATPAELYGQTVAAPAVGYVAFIGTDGAPTRQPILLPGTGSIALRGADFDPTTGSIWVGGTYDGTLTWDGVARPQINSNSSAFVGRMPLPIAN